MFTHGRTTKFTLLSPNSCTATTGSGSFNTRSSLAITCRITGGIPSANGSSGDTAILEIAAIIDDL